MRLMPSVLLVLTVISGGRDFSRATADDQSTIQQTNDRFVREWRTRIAGRENEPAGKVFENIRLDWFKSTPAGTLLEIMDGGYALKSPPDRRAINCGTCHRGSTDPHEPAP
jgi:hypothetical protein